MATFEATRTQFAQEHFEVLEIDLPVIEGTCTIGGSLGFGTPLSCDQTVSTQQLITSDGDTFKTTAGENFFVLSPGNTHTTRTYKFTNANAPLLSESSIFRCINSINETVTELKPGEGLSSRGSLTVKFNDFINDPNVDTAGVTDAVKNAGTFFGKLNARQIVTNKEVRIKLYRVESDGSIDLASGAQARHYSIESLTNNGKGSWSLRCKDELSVANIDEKTWPDTPNGTLRTDVNDSVVAIPVDSSTDYSAATVVLIGDEFMKVNSVSNNLTATATLNVATRGSSIIAPVSGLTLTRTEKDSHDSGDEVFICRVSDNEEIDDLLFDVLTDSDVDAARIPTVDWAAEIAEWHSATKVNTLWYKSRKVNDVLKRILTAYLMDMWFDPEDREIKLSAISVWKESSSAITEGSEMNSESIRVTSRDEIRASRALAVYKKKYLARSDDVENYAKASQFSDPTLITDVLFGKHKDKLFEPSEILDNTSAALLVQRYVSRFKFTPKVYTWITPERKLNFNTGDVVDISTGETQGFNGASSGDERAQIISISPRYKSEGREYTVKAITYEPAFPAGTAITLSSPLREINLFVLAGAPSAVVTITFIIDGVSAASGSSNTPAIIAGTFAATSKIIIILRNGADLQGKGGNGGGSEAVDNGDNGGIVYDAQGIDTDIYLGGADPESGTASGFLRAPGGGGGSGRNDITGGPEPEVIFPGGGGGGAGLDAGFGGIGFSPATSGGSGNGSTGLGGTGGLGDGTAGDGGDGGDWGDAGSNGGSSPLGAGGTGGTAGKGIVKSGAVVKLFGDTPTNFINGIGDTPDP